MFRSLILTDSEVVAVGAASAQSTVALAGNAGALYVICASVGCFVRQGANPTATVGTGSTYIPPNTQVLVAGECGTKLAFIQATTGGSVSITRVLN